MADVNVANGHTEDEYDRFSWMPATVDIPLGDSEDVVEISLAELYDDPTELCTLLENGVEKTYWILTALAYAKQSKIDTAIGILKQGLASFSGSRHSEDRLGLLSALCWMYLWKCREAPRIAIDNVLDAPAFWTSSAQLAVNGVGRADDTVKTKEFWLREATGTLNEASRISPSYPPVFLARGVLSLLRASIQKPDERQDSLRQALKSFDDALRSSGGRNIMATMGRARVLYALGKYNDAYSLFQSVLKSAPTQTDPDPRIGIGACLWQLGHFDEARNAWERALELRPSSKTALMMNAIYWLHASSQLPTTDPNFRPMYNRAMQELTQKAWKVDKNYPIINSTFGSFFMTMKKWPQMQKLAKIAIEQSEVSPIASDGWYLLARMAHSQGELKQALEFYSRADQARGGDGRGGDEKGYLPAKFGMAQIKVLLDDNVDAKFRLERLYRQNRSPEVMTLLGTLYAEDYFSSPIMGAKDEEKAEAWKKAVSLLEAVRTAWKDSKRKYTEDPDVLLNLARLYETESPEKSVQCLQHVEKIQIDKLPEDKKAATDDEDALRAQRTQLPPELINNIGCFQYQAEKYSQATASFQDALEACVRVRNEDTENEIDTDSLVTSISYNLARSYEAQAQPDEARGLYEQILARHAGYLDAEARLAYIKLKEDPAGEGPKKMSEVFHSAEDNLELRALYGWYLSKAKRKTGNVAEDQEQRHMKRTLRDMNKHDHYSLIAMGNVHLAAAREMDRLTDQDKDKRRKMYHKAVEFFAKALELDEKNAYAVQGLAIAITEDQKSLSTGIQLFTQVREVLKDVSVYMNLGHAYCELKQYSRSIENVRIHSPKQMSNFTNYCSTKQLLRRTAATTRLYLLV
jgi:RNA polymerase-associated protein CTR9